ncbi:flippase [Spirochaetia bacterium]|nr:flippase [Spirochaetia bacterium]
MSEKSLKKNAAYNVIRNVMQLAYPLVTFPYASRILLPEGIGKVNFANSIISYFLLVAGLGVNIYGIREGAKARNNRAELSKLSCELLTINLISTGIAYILFVLALFFIPKLEEYRRLLCICSATIIFTTLGIDWLYGALEDYRYITIRSAVFQGISLVFLFLIVKNAQDYVKYAGISVFASVGSNLLNFFHSRKFITFKFDRNLELKKHLKPVFILFAWSLSISIYTVLDITMLGLMAGDASVGIYSAAIKLNKMVVGLITSASMVLLPRLSFYIGQQKSDEFIELIHKSFNFLLCISIPAAVGLFLLSKPIILLFCGPNYTPAIPIMQIMSPIVFIIAIGHPIAIQLFMPLGKEKLTLFSIVCGAICNFSLNLFLIPRFGALGAGIATLCTEIIILAVQMILARKYLNLRKTGLNFVQCLIAVIFMTAAILVVLHFISAIILQIVVSIVMGIFIYSSLLLVMRNKMICSLADSGIYQIKNHFKNIIKGKSLP